MNADQPPESYRLLEWRLHPTDRRAHARGRQDDERRKLGLLTVFLSNPDDRARRGFRHFLVTYESLLELQFQIQELMTPREQHVERCIPAAKFLMNEDGSPPAATDDFLRRADLSAGDVKFRVETSDSVITLDVLHEATVWYELQIDRVLLLQLGSFIRLWLTSGTD